MKPALRERIEEQSINQIRSFLDELANGTRNYRSLHNLTQQIEHQYHGRFAIELLQNAHDAISLAERELARRRVALLIAPNEGPFGSLYVANDGRPFTNADFEAVASLGQSHKDPNQCVGNKGIGFRSVLEITNAPEIYSGGGSEELAFVGYCFGFDPQFVATLANTIAGLLSDASVPELQFSGNCYPLVDWSAERRSRFQQRWSTDAEGLKREIQFLSPYLLPLPRPTVPQEAHALAREGFATTIRLPLKSREALSLVEEQLDSLAHGDLLFLHEIEEVRVRTTNAKRVLRRVVSKSADQAGGMSVKLMEGDEITGSYSLWSRRIGGEDDSAGSRELADAARNLPGRWPELQEARIGVAVRNGEEPAEGRFSIFLPTDLPTGTFAHLNAPFFGEMSRTKIDLEEPLNQLLLSRLGALVADVARQLSGGSTAAAAIVIDLLAPAGSNSEARAALLSEVKAALDKAGASLTESKIFLTTRGWQAATKVRAAPSLPNAKVLTAPRFADAACFPLLHPSLASRALAARELLSDLDCDFSPSHDELADTVENAAKDLFQRCGRSASWTDFWLDVQELLRARSASPHPLHGKRVLLADDGKLVAPGSGRGRRRVFSLPRESAQEPESPTASEIPRSLKRHLAFLAPELPLSRKKGGKSEISDYLKAGDPPLVHDFRREDLIREVLIPATPRKLVPRGDSIEQRCLDILLWALRLVLTARDSQTLEPLLGSIRVPCRGGWYRAREAIFGEGWPHTVGDLVAELSEDLDVPSNSAFGDRLLLPPDTWASGLSTEQLTSTLAAAGVRDGLPLEPLSAPWNPSFWMNSWQTPELPQAPPSGVSEALWRDYCDAVGPTVQVQFQSEFEYRLDPPHVFPGLSRLDALGPDSRAKLATVLIRSIASWTESWASAKVSKVEGQAHSQRIESLAHYALRSREWLPVVSADPDENRFRHPGATWLIPSADLQGRRHQFSHLTVLDLDVANAVERDARALARLDHLGVAKFPKDERSSDARLLEALAEALQNGEMREANRDVFLGHVRHAWRCLSATSQDELPSRFIVREGGSGLSVRKKGDEAPVYLPDARGETVNQLMRAGLPTLEIEPREAQHFRSLLVAACEGQIRPLSRAEARITVKPPIEDGATQALIETHFSWIPTFALAIAAYYGDRSHGTETKRFLEAVGRLRTARLAECESVSIEFLWDEQRIIQREARAAWLRELNILVIASPAHENLESLAVPLEDMLERGDLLVPLRLALSKLPAQRIPAIDDRTAALGTLDISQSQLAEVEQHWLGDLDWARERLRPAVRLLVPYCDLSLLDTSDTLADLEKGLGELLEPDISAPRLLEVARTSDSDAAMGRALFEWLGERAELSHWNRALHSLGPSFSVVRNENAANEARGHISSSSLALLAVARRIALDADQHDLFIETRATLDSFELPAGLSALTWELSFASTMKAIASVLEHERASADYAAIVAQSESPKALQDELRSLGVDPDSDPEEILADNLRLVRKTVETLLATAVIQRERRQADLGPWAETPEALASRASEGLASGLGYLRPLNDGEIFAIVRDDLSCHVDDPEFWESIEDCSNIASVLGNLGVSEADLKTAQDTAEKLKERERRRSRMVKVCGRDFDSDPSNLVNLWSLLSEALPDNRVTPFDLGGLAQLEEVPEQRARAKRRGSGGGERRRRMTEAERRLVGLAGEIIAFRSLRQTFGVEISSRSWVSENSLEVFPGNSVDDNLGYDFDVSRKGQRYLIEVKATVGDEAEFEMGPSQVECAIEYRDHPQVQYLVCRVRRALTDDPSWDLLPNPFEQSQRGRFRIHDAGMKVEYRKADSSD